MIEVYTPEQVAAKYAHAIPSKDPVRWLKRRLFDGRIRGKRLSRNVVVMTERHIDMWLNADEAPALQRRLPVAAPAQAEEKPAPVGFLTSVSNRRRIKVPQQSSGESA